MDLEDIVYFFVNLQTTKTKEEAFLKGVLFGYGGYLACPTPSWELMKEYPHMIDVENENYYGGILLLTDSCASASILFL